MCGIIGWIGLKKAIVPDRKAQHRALSKLSHRGPDNQGMWEAPHIWLGHCRLSILDVRDIGNQPMLHPSGDLVITYNGEIYNHLEIRKKITSAIWRGHSDTETLLEAFHLLGTSCINECNGMFAFAIYDRRVNKVFFSRDRIGIKPFYVYKGNENIIFCSELRPLFELLGFVPPFANENLGEWFTYGNSLGGKTLFQGVEQVLPGEIWEIDIKNFQISKSKYWSLQNTIKKPKPTYNLHELAMETRRLLERSVQNQLLSDVPVGIFLSGGIDSSAITAFAARHSGRKLKTFTAGFDESSLPDERIVARKTAKQFGTEHEEFIISGDNLPSTIEHLIEHHGSPFSDAANIPLYLMAKEISKKVKVILQGDGGDELFGGYRRYTTLAWRPWFRAISKLGTGLGRTLPASHLRQRIVRYAANYQEVNPAKTIARLLSAHGPDISAERLFPRLQAITERATHHYLQKYEQLNTTDLVETMSRIDMEVILPDIFLEKVDRATMSHGLEARVPFLDHNLIEFIMGLPSKVKFPYGKKKWLLKRALNGIISNQTLYGKKTGFSVPYGKWLQGPLREHFHDNFASMNQQNKGWINEEEINKLLLASRSEKSDHWLVLWEIYQLCIWINRFKVQINNS